MIVIDSLKKTFENGKDKNEVLKGLSFSLPQKGMVAVVGDSGSGKSTLLSIMGSLDLDYEGSIKFQGMELKEMTSSEIDIYRSKKIGFVFQDFNLIDELTLEENILLASDLNYKESQERCNILLERMNLISRRKTLARVLSGGEKQRGSIARALMNDTLMILADEPTGSLDKKNSIQVMEILKEISKERLVVVISHNERLVSEYADRILQMEDGMIVDVNPSTHYQIETYSPEKRGFFPRFKRILSLSLKFVMSSKLKTALVSLGSSFTILSLGLVLAMNFGFTNYLDNMEERLLRQIPLAIEETGLGEMTIDTIVDVNSYVEADGKINVDKSVNNLYSINSITDEFVDYLNEMDSSWYSSMRMSKGTSFYMIYQDGISYDNIYDEPTTFLNSLFSDIMTFKTLPDIESVLDDFDVVAGTLGNQEDSSMVIVLTSDNSLSSSVIDALGIDSNRETIDFDEVLDREYYFVGNDDYYIDIGDPYNPKEVTGLFLKRAYDLKEEGRSIYDLSSIETENMDASDFKELVQYIEIPEGRNIDLDSVDYSDRTQLENLLFSLFQTKTIPLYREMNNSERRTYIENNPDSKVSVSAIIKPKKDSFIPSLKGGIYLTEGFRNRIEEVNTPDFVDRNNDGIISSADDIRPSISKTIEDCCYIQFDGNFNLKTLSVLGNYIQEDNAQSYIELRRKFGVDCSVSSIMIYPNSLENKDKIVSYINDYSNTHEHDITVTDLTGIVFSNVSMVMDIAVLILVILSAISALVSVLLIASIIYSSTIERKREIGIMRSFGSSLVSINVLFDFMGMFYGLLSGVIGVALTYIASLVINKICSFLYPAYMLDSLCFLPFYVAALLVVLSVVISLLSSVVPSLIASRKDPWKSLKS